MENASYVLGMLIGWALMITGLLVWIRAAWRWITKPKEDRPRGA